jgi:protein-S-isoprenylcysteine O-methyltransferase Ste14
MKQRLWLFSSMVALAAISLGLPVSATGQLGKILNSLSGLGFMAIFTLWLLVEAWFVNHQSVVTRRHRLIRFAFGCMIYGGLLFTLLDFATRPQGGEFWALTGVGLALAALGVALRYASIRALGSAFTYELQILAGQRLIQAGPYRYIRHPSYAAILLLLGGLPLIFQSWYGFFWLCLVCGGFLLTRIPREETMMLEAFGEAYREYMRHTKRLIPFIY